MSRIAIMALEGLEEEVVVEQTTGVEQIADQPENDMAEMQVAQTQIQGVDDAMDEAAETGQTLVQVHDQMAQTVADGGQGLEPAAAQAVQVAVEHMVKRLGFATRNSKFALEGFADKSTRVKATMEAMDDIKGFFSRIWAAIVAACKTAIDWIVKYYDKLFDGAQKLAKRAKEVGAAAAAKEKAGATLEKDAKVTKGVMNQFNFKKYLVKGNVFMTSSEIVAACKMLTALNDIEANAANVLSESAAVSSEDKSGAVMTKINGFLKYLGLREIAGFGKLKPAEGMKLYGKDLPFGNFGLYSYQIADESKTPELVGKIKVFVDSNSDKENTGTLSEAPFSIDDIKASAEMIEKHMNGYANIRVKQAELKKKQQETQAAAEKAAKAEGATEESKKATMMNAAVVRAQISLTTNTLSAIRSYDISACKAVLDYASKSLGGYSGGTAAAAQTK